MNTIKINAKALRFVASIHHSKLAFPAIGGILLEADRIVATDAFHLAYVDKPYAEGQGVAHSIRMTGLPAKLPNVGRFDMAELSHDSDGSDGEVHGHLVWPNGKVYGVTLHKVEQGDYPVYRNIIPDGNKVAFYDIPLMLGEVAPVIERMNDYTAAEIKKGVDADTSPCVGSFVGFKDKPQRTPMYRVAHGNMVYIRAALRTEEVKEWERGDR